MPDQRYSLECCVSDVALLIKAGASAGAFDPAVSIKGKTFSVFKTADFAVLDRWRLLLNREARPYRYFAHLDGNRRELGRSRSPDWLDR
jgi:hypothetical protein